MIADPRRLLALLLPLVLAGACASAPERPTPTEFLDPQTAMTVRVVAEPFVYARDVPELAANVRDYLYVGAVETNNMGSRKEYLALIAWSTIDRKRQGVPPAGMPDRLELSLGSQSRSYPLTTHEPRTIGVGTPVLEPPAGYLGESWFVISAADLRAFGAEPPKTLDVLVGEERQTYTLWKRADAALSAFIEDTPSAMAPATSPR
jgi:hypothetical protein